MFQNTTITNGIDTSRECEVINQTTVNSLFMRLILSTIPDVTHAIKVFDQDWEVLGGGQTINAGASRTIIPDQHVKNTKTGEMMAVFLYKQLSNNADRYAPLANSSVMQDFTATPPSYPAKKAKAFPFVWAKFLKRMTYDFYANDVGHSRIPLA